MYRSPISLIQRYVRLATLQNKNKIVIIQFYEINSIYTISY
jgi:hypothetical protein